VPFVKRPTDVPPEVLGELEAAGHGYLKAQRRLGEATRRRDEAIRAASDAGMTRRAVAQAAGVTVGRVQQILDQGRR
jgi:hypothetical protein